MASTEHGVISKVLQERDVLPVIKAGVTTAYFHHDESRLHWEWIISYWQEYGTAPTVQVFRRNYPNTRVVDMSGERWRSLLDQLIDAHQDHLFRDGLSNIFTHEQDRSEALDVMRGLLDALAATEGLHDTDVTQTWEARLARYEEIRQEPDRLRGISTGFETLDRLLGGWRKQQLVTLIGTPKKGKSLLLLVMAMAAHAQGLRPMLLTFEMSNEEQEARYDSLLAHLNSNDLLRGKITAVGLEALRRAMKLTAGRPPFILVEDPTAATTVTSIGAKIQEHNPAVVFVDGMYLMDDETQGNVAGSPQAITQITRGLKRLAQRFDVPIIGTTQALEWKVGRGGRLSTYSIGYSSSFSQDSDILLGVESDPEDDTVAIVRILAARSAARGELRINWDWKRGDFTELDVTNEMENDDDLLD